MFYKLQQYFLLMRLNTVNRVGLLMLPTLASLELSRYLFNISLLNSVKYYIVFIVGSVLMRSFGCIVNDYFDKDFDKLVERTKNRPLALGTVTTKEAFILLVVLGAASFMLLITLPKGAIVIALLSLILVVVYPLSKRFFKMPQLILGFAFNWGVLVAATLFDYKISSLHWLLFLSFILNTIVYDTIYAYQDYKDDLRLNIHSFTKVLKSNFKVALVLCYLIMLFLLIYIFIKINMHFGFIAVFVFASLYIIYLLTMLNINNLKACYNFFKANVWYQLLIFLLLLFNNFINLG